MATLAQLSEMFGVSVKECHVCEHWQNAEARCPAYPDAAMEVCSEEHGNTFELLLGLVDLDLDLP